MSHHVLSVLLSSSLERFPDSHATLVSESFGLSEYSRSNLSATLDARHKALVSKDKPIHTARSIFVELDYLLKGTLLCLSHAHGLELYRYLLSQITHILMVRPLKRLLDLHGIRYADTDNIRKLRKHLSCFRKRLGHGKCAEDEPTVTGTARHIVSNGGWFVISTSRSQLKPSPRSLAVVATSYAPFRTKTRFVADDVIATDGDDTSRPACYHANYLVSKRADARFSQLIHTDGRITSVVPHVSMRDEHRTSLGSGNAPVYSRIFEMHEVNVYHPTYHESIQIERHRRDLRERRNVEGLGCELSETGKRCSVCTVLLNDPYLPSYYLPPAHGSSAVWDRFQTWVGEPVDRDDGTHYFHATCCLYVDWPFQADIIGILESIVELDDDKTTASEQSWLQKNSVMVTACHHGLRGATSMTGNPNPNFSPGHNRSPTCCQDTSSQQYRDPRTKKIMGQGDVVEAYQLDSHSSMFIRI
ncbi:hypothetical protein B0H13DRAFT_1930672 [Mycena leptocephala]|nr:hypothetical protein B0H13DRAFT_1930672 [Mycena leptocephala]